MWRIYAGHLIIALLWAQSATAQLWLQETEVTQDPPVDGRRVVTVRLLPARTATYDELRFECPLQQIYAWTNSRGESTIKTNTPVLFTHRRPTVTLTDDLDAYINFRVPVSYERLARAYGEKTFRADQRVIIPHLRIQARRDGNVVWEHQVPAQGITRGGPAVGPDPASLPATPPTGRKEIDLDG